MPATLAPHAPGPAGYRRWQRGLAVAALVALGAPLIAGLVAPPLVAGYVQRTLRAAGYADAVVDWRTVGLLHAEGRLRLDAAQSVERITLDYGPHELLRGRIGRVRLDGLRLRVARTADGRYTLSGLRTGPAATPAPTLPFGQIELDDARIELPLPDGSRLVLPLSLTLQTGADGAQVLDGTVGALAPGFGARVHGTLAANGTLSAAAAFEIAETGAFLAGLDRPLPVYGRLRGVVRLNRTAGSGTAAGPHIELEADGDSLRWGDWLTDGTLGLAVRIVPTGNGPDGPGGYALYARQPLTLAYTPGPALAARLPPDLATAPLRLGLHAPDDEPVLALPADAPARLSGELGLSLGQIGIGGPVEISHAAGRIGFALREAALGLPVWAMAGAGLTLTGTLADTPPYALRAHIGLPALSSNAHPALHAPLALSGDCDGALDGVLGCELALSLAGGPVLGRLDGRHDCTDGRGELHLRNSRITLGDTDTTDTVSIATLSPALAASVEAARGRIAAGADAGWGDGHTQTRGELRVTALELVTRSGARAQGIDGVLRADRLLPLHVPPGQPLAIARLDAGLPLTDGLVELAVDDGRLQVRAAGFALAGGRLRLDPLTAAADGRPVPVGIDARGLELGRLLELVAVDGLAGDGTLNGRIRARLEAGGLHDVQARFETAAPGVLRYTPQSPPAGLADGQAGIALEVLRDFRYESLVLTLAGARPESIAVGLAVRGANPQVYGGHPVALNLSLTGAVTGLLQQGIDGYRLPDAVRRRLEQYEPREQP